jgi:hypothetical protein
MGVLNDIGNVLSAPRRALWGMAGLPSSGDELVSNLGLAQRGSLLSRGLGMGAEMLGDPMTYLGGALGGLGGEALGGLLEGGGEAAGAGGDIEALLSARRAAQEGLTERDALQEEARAEAVARIGRVGQTADVAGLAAGDTKNYLYSSPQARELLDYTGMGSGSPGGRAAMPPPTEQEKLLDARLGEEEPPEDLAGATTYGRRPPSTHDVYPSRNPATNRMRGSQLDLRDENAGRLSSHESYDPPELTETAKAAQPTISPYERYLLMRESAKNGGIDALESIHGPGASPHDMLARVGSMAGDAAADDVAMPGLAEQMKMNFMPRAHIGAIDALGLAHLPIDQGFAQSQVLLAKAIAARQLAQAGQLGLRDYAMIGAAGGAAGGAGGALAKSLAE